jgi:glycosyltransferase involved in cell wall biosynthesis
MMTHHVISATNNPHHFTTLTLHLEIRRRNNLFSRHIRYACNSDPTQRNSDMTDQAAADYSVPAELGLPDLGLKLPLVSIIIANYNYAPYVCAAIRSVQAQTYTQFECIVVDDCSTDSSFDAIMRCLNSMNDRRFRFIRLDRNRGQMGAIKAAIDNCSGAFTVILDADDMLLPDFLRQHMMAHLNSSFSAGVSASDTLQIDENGQILETTFHSFVKPRSEELCGPIKPIPAAAINPIDDAGHFSLRQPDVPAFSYIERRLDGWHVVQMSSLMFRTNLIRCLIPHDTESARICADYYLYVCSHLLTGTITIPSPLSCYRLHRKNRFSANPAVGGAYQPGQFAGDLKTNIDREIAKHVMANFETLASMCGTGACEKLIKRSLRRHEIYDALKHHPTLQCHLGRGRAWRFRAKYLLYKLLKRR